MLLQLIEQLKQICIEFHGAEEYGEESHLPHVHIAFKTVGRKTYRSLWNILRKFECWFEPAKNFKKAVIYATKGERDEKFKSEYESGKFRAFHLGEMAADKTGQRRNETNDLLFLIRDKMASGEWDEDTIANLYPQIFQRYNKVIIQFTVERSRMVVYNECKQNAFARRDLTVWWFYGREGSGKSMRARQELFNYCCQQNPNNGFFVQSSFKWVNGYKSGMPVLIDDFRAGNLASAGYQLDHLLKVLDAYSFLREIKNGFTIWNPPLIIITSFFDPVESFKDTRNPNETVNLARMESLGQLVRRLNLIVEFDRKVVTNSEQGGEVFVEQFVQRDRTKYFYDMFELVPRPGKVVPLLFGGEARGANE